MKKSKKIISKTPISLNLFQQTITFSVTGKFTIFWDNHSEKSFTTRRSNFLILFRYPFPIDCDDVPEDLKNKFSTYEEYLNDLSNHTYFMMGNGPVYSIKIGRVSMDTQ